MSRSCSFPSKMTARMAATMLTVLPGPYRRMGASRVKGSVEMGFASVPLVKWREGSGSPAPGGKGLLADPPSQS